MSNSLVLIDKASSILEAMKKKEWRLATAESCTGGLISALFTEISGSSAVFACGFVTYSNASKTALLGVDDSMLESRGAVSEPTARAMALGCAARTGADISVAVTGIAGPDGGTKEKPVGLVYIAVARKKDGVTISKNQFNGERESVRQQAVAKALEMIEAAL